VPQMKNMFLLIAYGINRIRKDSGIAKNQAF